MKFEIKLETTSQASADQMSDGLRTEYLAEYSALRDEITKRIDMRNRLLTFTLVLAGVFLSAGVEIAQMDPTVLLVYPILATFLAAAWTHSDVRIGQLGEYIKEKHEKKLKGLKGWETHVFEVYSGLENWLVKNLVVIYASGIFLSTQILVILVAVFRPGDKLNLLSLTPESGILLFFDCVGFIWTLSLISLRRRRYRTRILGKPVVTPKPDKSAN